MQIQKSSVYSSTLGARVLKNRAEADRRTQEKTTGGNEVQGDLVSTEERAAVPRLVSGPAKTSGITIHSIDTQRLFELNPRLDRTTRNALDAYESMQHQFEVEQRESVSKLLGIDLYV